MMSFIYLNGVKAKLSVEKANMQKSFYRRIFEKRQYKHLIYLFDLAHDFSIESGKIKKNNPTGE